MLVHHFLRDSVQRAPDDIAVIDASGTTTYRQLDEFANRFAAFLVARGVHPGDRVALAMDNSADLVACYFGVLRAGGVAVPLPSGTRDDRLAKAIRDCAPRVCVLEHPGLVDASSATALQGLAAVLFHRKGAAVPAAPLEVLELRAAITEFPAAPVSVPRIDLDLAALIYTSGSTGEPRGVMLTHRNLVANTRSIVAYLGLTAQDRVMCVLPFHYVYGLSLFHTHIAVGGSVIIENRFAFPAVVLEAMASHGATGLAGVPSTFTLLLNRTKLSSMEFPRLRYVTQAGGGMSPARIRDWLERGFRAPFFVMYGATEASARLTYLHPRDLERKMGSIGRAIPNVEVFVLTEDGRRAEPDEVGELVARGSNIALGYWNSPSETAERFGSEGYRTGDLGYADSEGFLFLTGRRHDMIKVGAHRVGPKEIEDVLNEYPGVSEAAVVGMPHDVLGEAPHAFISIQPLTDGGSFDVQALQAFCRVRLPPHKMPQKITVCGQLPRLGTGKIDRQALRSLTAPD
jgi:long-chain acyl-CoA synthetase